MKKNELFCIFLLDKQKNLALDCVHWILVLRLKIYNKANLIGGYTHGKSKKSY
jgi:hypothetical protein